jgi:formylglycine-generating enzyme required for sulfatase activity
MRAYAALSLFVSLVLATGAWSADKTLDSIITNSAGVALVLIPAGEFMMGSSPEESERMLQMMKQKGVHAWYQNSPPGEVPRHEVRISSPFYMGMYEVTLGQFRAFVDAASYRTDAEKDGKGGDGKLNGKWTIQPQFNWKNMGFERSDDMPVVNVTWNDAVAFCEWLASAEGHKYRLPTEAEWEYACRAGATTRNYWGDDESRRNEYAWHNSNSGGTFHPVGQLKANAFGLYDMCGNAYEYCSDWFSTYAYASIAEKPVADPKGPASGTEKVVRGGSWGTDPMHCRSAFRGGAGLTHRNMRDGFRVVRTGD